LKTRQAATKKNNRKTNIHHKLHDCLLVEELQNQRTVLIDQATMKWAAFAVYTSAAAACAHGFATQQQLQQLVRHHRPVLISPRQQQTQQHYYSTTLLRFAKQPNNNNDKVQPLKQTQELASSFVLNPLAAGTWFALVAWAFTVAPGRVASESDAALLASIVANPACPGMNELYYTAFNMFAVIPLVLGMLVVPQGSRRGLPAGPFLLVSAFLGYFALGPYLALRATPRSVLQEKVSWFTTNVLENKLFAVFVLAFTLYIPVATHVIPAWQTDATSLVDGFAQLITTSRFASVSLVDLSLLTACAVALTPRDYQLRQPTASDKEAWTVALATALLPLIGSAVYCVIRPKLPMDTTNALDDIE
jgi:hypothetical protein